MRAKLHADCEMEHPSGIEQRIEVISVNIGGKRVVMHYSSWYDNRGSHYGEKSEQCSIIKEKERKKFLKKYRGITEVSDEMVEALLKSKSGSVARESDGEYRGSWQVINTTKKE